MSLLALASAASAQEVDLKEVVDRKPVVGEKTRTVEEEHRTQALPNGRKVETRPASTYVEEVQAVGQDGEPTRTLRTYEAYRDAQGNEVPVAGVKVEITRDEAAGKYAYAAAEGSAALPRPLEGALRAETMGKTQRHAKGATDDAVMNALLPSEPKGPGGTWSVDIAGAVTAMGLDPNDVDLQASRGTGTLEGLESADGRDWVEFSIALEIVLAKMQGNPLPAPAPMNTTMSFKLPKAGDGPDGESRMVQHVELQGPNGKMVMDNVKTQRRTIVR